MAILEVRNLSKKFDDVQVLKDISFDVNKGEVIAIIGPSGSGKSTLLRSINQFEKADGGEITVCDMDMLVKDSKDRTVFSDAKTLRDIRLKIGLVFQNFNLFPHMTVLGNIIEAPVKVLKTPKAEAVEKAMELLKKMGLSEKANAYPYELSGGQQQRVSIARAIVNQPELILADEPTGNLDPITSEEIVKLLMEINKKHGTTVLMATHDYIVLDKFRAKVIACEDGKIVS